MGFLRKLFGGGDERERIPPDAGRRRAPAQSADEQAVERYRYMLRTAPPESSERAHEEAFARLTPEQRRLKTLALGGGMAPPRRFVPARDGYWDGYAFRIDPAFPALAAEIAARRGRA